MKPENLVNPLFAVIFSSGEPISIGRLCETFNVEPHIIQETADLLEKSLKDSALELLTLENTYQLATKKEYAQYIKTAFDIKRKTPLSQAALEVLAVVAYNQPVTKSFIEQVRGVDCSGVITTLLEKELLEEKGRLELPGRPLLYGTTKNFLRCFNLSSLQDLPELPKVEGVVSPDIAEQISVEEQQLN
ncbi:MAG: SMC-Scp complex subunit ScpB [Clostridia bacterium]|nr:SMC-Scp complex subunit ScpB [Clostridia bacterium]